MRDASFEAAPGAGGRAAPGEGRSAGVAASLRVFHRGLLGIALVLAACAEERASRGAALDPPSAPPERLTPVPRSRAAPAARTLALGEELTPWRVEGGRGERVEGADGAPRLALAGAPELRVTIPSALAPANFGRLLLPVTSSADVAFEVHASLRLGGATVAAEPRGVELAAGATLELELAVPQGLERAEELTLVFAGELGAGLELAAPRLEYAAPAQVARALASAASGPQLTALGNEWRPAWWLASERDLTLDLSVPAEGARLALGYGLSPSARGAPREVQVRVRVRREGAPLSELRLALHGVDRWFDVSLPLPGRVGERLSLELALEFEGRGAAYAAIAEPRVVDPAGSAPLVVLVTSDTHRGDHLGGALRGVDVATPVLDELAARGVQFLDCLASSHITIPSHAALFTGTHPRDTGVLENFTVLADEARTLAEAFGEAGYLTAAATSLNVRHTGIGQGFDRLSVPHRKRDAHETLDVVLPWIEAAADEPLFLWVHLFDAHAPYRPPEAFASRYYPADADPFDPARTPDLVPPAWLAEARDAEYLRALYRGEVSFLDDALARLFDRPRVRAGVLVFTSDHGECLGEHGTWWTHNGVYPDVLHVPLILSWPGAEGRTRVLDPVRQIDLGRTLLDLAGLDEVAFDGLNLLRAVAEDALGGRARFALSAERQAASINLGGLHGVLHLRDYERDYGYRGRRHEFELYELSSDPDCERDLAAERPAAARELRGRLVSWLRRWNGGRWSGGPVGNAETRRNLARLGYGEGLEQSGEALDELFPEDCPCAACARLR